MDNRYDFTQGSILRKMARFMLPILAALVLQCMYSAVDLMIVGHFGTTEGISGVSTGANIMNLFTHIATSLTTAVTVLMGQYIGAGKSVKIGKLMGNAIVFFTLLGIVLSVTVCIFARQIAFIMQAPEEAVDATVTYIRICGAGYIFVVFYNFISSVFRGMGNSKLPLLFVGIACVINIIGDLVLVALFRMNVAGAAIATIFSQAVSVILSILVIRKQKLPFSLSVKELSLGSEVPHFLKIGVPLALQEVLTNVTFLCICAFVNRLGLIASSGYGVAQRITAFVLLVPSSIIQSMSSFVAQNVGAGLEKRASKAMLTGMLIGASIGVPIFLLSVFRGDLLAGIFTEDPAVIDRAFEYLRGFAFEAIVTSFLFSFLGYFNGHSQSTFVMIQGLIQSFCVRLPVSYVMSVKENASLMWIGFAAPAATVLGILMCTVYYFYCKRKRDSIQI